MQQSRKLELTLNKPPQTVKHKGMLMSEINAERTSFTQKAASFISDIATQLSISATRVSIVCSVSPSSDALALRCAGSPPLLVRGNSTQVRVVVSGVTPARLKKPTRLAFSADGSMLVISDTGNNAIRKIGVCFVACS